MLEQMRLHLTFSYLIESTLRQLIMNELCKLNPSVNRRKFRNN